MRVFWALIGVLVLGTGGLLLVRSSDGEGDQGVMSETSASLETARHDDEQSGQATVASEEAEGASVSHDEGDFVSDGRSVETPAAEMGASESGNAAEGIPESAPPSEDVTAQLNELLGLPEEPGPATSADGGADAATSDDVDATLTDASGEDEPIVDAAEAAGEDVAVDESGDVEEGLDIVADVASDEARDDAVIPDAAPAFEPGVPDVEVPEAVVEREDGTLLVAGTYVVRGEGTKEKPYEIGMDLLLSAQDVYDPRRGMKDLPAWTSRFNGRVVRITGNLLIPLWAEETDELLLMKNQWDGCCVGVPPTPYDAVEVTLSKRVAMSSLREPYGSVVGTFKVDPYIRSGWLLGLYVMTDARVE